MIQGLAIVELVVIEHLLHERRVIVVAGQAIHGQAQRAEQVSEVLVSFGAVVMDKVARDQRDIRLPVAAAIMVEDRAQRRMRRCAAQLT